MVQLYLKKDHGVAQNLIYLWIKQEDGLFSTKVFIK